MKELVDKIIDENIIDYRKEYYRLEKEVAAMLVENRRNYKTPMTPFELLSKWDKIREVTNTVIEFASKINTKEK